MSGAEAVLVATSVAGTGMGIYGGIAAAEAQREAANRDAHFKRLQADEIIQRQAINERILRERAEEEGSRFASSFASTGREGGGVGGILKIKRDVDEAITLSRREAEFKAKMLRAGADIEIGLASDLVTSSYISGAGTLLSGAAQTYNAYRKPSGTPQKLGGY